MASASDHQKVPTSFSADGISKTSAAEWLTLGTETWIFLSISLSFATALGLLLHLATATKTKKRRLPPGPPAVQFICSLLWRRPRRSTNGLELEPFLRELHARHGPIVTLPIGSGPTIYISDRALIHEALVERGAAFADRRAPHPALRFLSADQHNISFASYGPLWRLLRRNFTSGILHPSRVDSFALTRARALAILTRRLRSEASSSDSRTVVAAPSLQFAMFCLLAVMCFGQKLDEEAIKVIQKAQRDALLHSGKLDVLAFVPSMSKYFFWNFWKRVDTALRLRERQKEVYLPLIRARQEYFHRKKKQQQQESGEEEEEELAYSYVDSLLDIELPEEGGRRLTDDEMVALCSEFLNAGTDTTATTLQWITANLVKHPSVQAKLFKEIAGVVGSNSEEVKEEHLQKMPYLKAVIMEGLRRHPPGHFLLPHAVTKETVIGGYTIPTYASINFAVAEMGLDGRMWEEPMEFRPERFLAGGPGEGVDITGAREIKMMPFGAGRRMCPAHGLAMLHLEYFVANLVWAFEWQALQGEEVDLAEKLEFTVVMQKPLRACIFPRRKSVVSR